MKYAVQDNAKIEATPGATGKCVCCGSELVPKCGPTKVWHWAHKSNKNCDHWWENETNWHRDWKNHFPPEWQEVVHYAEDGEKHIADVKTPSGLVVEFQHSYLREEERISRERYYNNMVWIVDGMRTKLDLKRVEKGFGLHGWNRASSRYCHGFEQDSYLPKNWLSSSQKVIFDFGRNIVGHPDIAAPGELICLEPRVNTDDKEEIRILFTMSRSRVLSLLIDGNALPSAPSRRLYLNRQ